MANNAAANRKAPAGASGAKSDNPMVALIPALFDKGWELREEYEVWVKHRKANREMLRGLHAQGLLSGEQAAELDELYPPRAKADPETPEAAEAAAAS